MKVENISIMTFQCEKCDKKFERQVDLTRHNERKIPCIRDLTCERCFKEFTQLGHLKNHMSRKFLCDNKKEELLLQLEIKKEDYKIKDKELQIAQEKTKQIKMENKNVITGNIINIITNNIINMSDIKSIKPNSHYDAMKLINKDNIQETLKQLVNLHFNNIEYPNNKCITIKDGKIYSKQNDQVVEFKHVRPDFNKIIKDTCESVEFDYGKYSEDEMYKYGTNQRDEHLSNEESNTLKRTSQYVGNHRNNTHVDNVLISTLN
jgi:hypothetical protein